MLESEEQLAPQGLGIMVALFFFEVIPFNLTNDVLSKGVVSSNAVAFEAPHLVCQTVHGVVDIGGCTLVIIVGN